MVPTTVSVPVSFSAPAVIPIVVTVAISSPALVAAGSLVLTAACLLPARSVLIVAVLAVVSSFRAARPIRSIMSVRSTEPFVPVRSSMIVMVVVSVVPVLPAVPVVFVVPATLRPIVVGLVMVRLIMVGLIVMRFSWRFFWQLFWWVIPPWGLLRRLRIRITQPELPARPVFAIRINRGHPAAAEQTEAARQTLIAGEEWEGALVAQSLQNAGIDGLRIRHIAVRPRNDAIATLL